MMRNVFDDKLEVKLLLMWELKPGVANGLYEFYFENKSQVPKVKFQDLSKCPESHLSLVNLGKVSTGLQHRIAALQICCMQYCKFIFGSTADLLQILHFCSGQF
jgi:hypothetical protein